MDFLTGLPRLGAKGKGTVGLKSCQDQCQKWSQSLSPMKIQQAEDSPPEVWKEPGSWMSPLLSGECGHVLFARMDK